MSKQKDLGSLIREFREAVDLAATRNERAGWLERTGRSEDASDLRFYHRQAFERANRLETELLTWMEA